MDVSVYNFYLEPGNELEFARKCNKQLIRKLDKKMSLLKIDSKFQDYTVSINVSPSKRIKYPKLIGPSFDRMNKYVVYTLVVSYKQIVSSDNPAKEYKEIIEDGFHRIIESARFAS